MEGVQAGLDHDGDASSPQARLLALFATHRLSPTQRLIARYVIDHPTEAPFLSSVSLAERSGVSQPSVTRLATTMGFTSYSELQRALRETVMASPDRGAPAGNKYQVAVSAEIRNLQALLASLGDLTTLEQSAARMMASPTLPAFGLRVSSPLAMHFGYFAAKLHPDVRVITDVGSVAADRLAQARLSGADTLLAVVLPRYPRETFEALEVARELGFWIVAVSDRRSPALDRLADVVLPAAVGTDLVFDLHLAPLMVLTALLEAMADVDHAASSERLEAFEQRAARSAFFTDG